MEKNQTIIIGVIIVAVIVVAAVAFVMMNNKSDDKHDDDTPTEVAKDVLDAIRKADSRIVDEYVLIEETDKTATLCTGESITAKRAKWIAVTYSDDPAALYEKETTEEDFKKNMDSDEISIMSEKFPLNHLSKVSGLVSGCGYWYNYTDHYVMLEYIGYDSDKHYLHMKIKIDDDTNSITDADIQKILKAAIGEL